MRLRLETIIGTAATVAHHIGSDTPRERTRREPDSGRSSEKSGRRQTLLQECSWRDVLRAIKRRRYEGDVVPAVRVDQVAPALDASPHPLLRRMRADGYATLRQLATVLAWSADWQVQRERKGQMLVSVPQRILAERCGRSERTVRRHLRVLEEVGLLATVREGTTPEFQPAALEGEGNVTPVYVLLLPVSVLADVPGCERLAADLNDAHRPAHEPEDSPESLSPASRQERPAGDPCPLALVARDIVVDIDVRPPFPPLGRERSPSHTRENASIIEPLRGTEPHGGAPRRSLRAAQRHLPTSTRSVTGGPEEERREFSQVNAPIERRWIPHQHPQTRADRLAASDELRWRVPVLRHVSAAHVRHAVREYFLAGWTVLDIHHAIDQHPDGTTWPHDGSDGVARPADWLAYRLAAWRDDAGTVIRSRSQRLAAERAEAIARTRARRENEVAARVRRAAALDSPTVAAAKAEIDAIRREFAARPKHHRSAFQPRDTRTQGLR